MQCLKKEFTALYFADKYVINGNGHKLEGSNKEMGFSFDNKSAHGSCYQ